MSIQVESGNLPNEAWLQEQEEIRQTYYDAKGRYQPRSSQQTKDELGEAVERILARSEAIEMLPSDVIQEAYRSIEELVAANRASIVAEIEADLHIAARLGSYAGYEQGRHERIAEYEDQIEKLTRIITRKN